MSQKLKIFLRIQILIIENKNNLQFFKDDKCTRNITVYSSIKSIGVTIT